MKFAVCLLLFCLSMINAHHTENTWGNVDAKELGTHLVNVHKGHDQYTTTQFTYPEVRNVFTNE